MARGIYRRAAPGAASAIEREDGWRAPELPGERRAAFCRLEHVVPWAHPGPALGAGRAGRAGGLADSIDACAHCGEPLGRRARAAGAPPRRAPHPRRLLLGRAHGRLGEGGGRWASCCWRCKPELVGALLPSPRSRTPRARRSRRRAPRRPARTSSRFTPAAKLGCLSFFFTDLGVMPSMPVGRTSAQAAMKPDSSSTAKSVLASGVSRGTPRKVGVAGHGVDQLLRVAPSARAARARARVAGVEVGVALVVEVVEQPRDRPELLVLAVLARVGAHRRLDAEQVLAQRLGLDPLLRRASRPRRASAAA